MDRTLSMSGGPRNLCLALIDLTCLLVSKVLPWLLAIWLVVAVKDTAISLSGQGTLLAAAVKLASNLRVTRGFAFIFGAFGIYYGFQQRKLRRASEQHLRERVARLQRELTELK